LKVNASGGSGTYNYNLQGPTTVDFTSSNVITGLQPGTYTLTVKDINTTCMLTVKNIVIPGTYSEPRFGLTETDPTCMSEVDGTISVSGVQNGRMPFTYKLVAPSPMGVGTTSSTGQFTGLVPGSYAVQMIDSCGDIQTRAISIQTYNWSITSVTVQNSGCQIYSVKMVLTDSKGKTNASGTTFNGWQYGYVLSPGDTTWFTTGNFSMKIFDSRSVVFVAKDKCGVLQTSKWTNTAVPSVASNVTISGQNCNGFNVAITGQQNLTTPNYCLFDASGKNVTGQPCNTTGSFTAVPYGSYCIRVTNSCYDTVMNRCFTQTRAVPSIGATATLSNYSCTTFTATVTGQTNLTNPQYCLVDSKGKAVSGQSCNATGVFSGLPYGAYKINVTDGCTGTVLPVAVNGVKQTSSVNSTITVSGTTCNSFNASLGGATNLSGGQYCLLDAQGHTVTCNSTGNFNNLAYGSYCINATDACGDTTIKRCVTVAIPVQQGGTPTVSNAGCTGYTITVTGQQNIYNGQYCLLDANGNTLTCNATGVFTNVAYGKVCVQTTDGCTGAIFKNCITETQPVPSAGPVTLSGQSCTGFTATVSNQANLTSPSFCLYNQAGSQVGVCNSNGVFNVAAYGTYTIKLTDGCTGKVISLPFTAKKPLSNVGANVGYSNQDCNSFTANIQGPVNLAGASYFLKDNSGNVISTNTTGSFPGLAYGSYCIDITSACGDTTLERCFTLNPTPVVFTATATPSCTFASTDLAIKVTQGNAPYVVSVYDTLNNLFTSVSFSGSSVTVKGVPTLPTTKQYKVIVAGKCGSPDTLLVTAKPSMLSHLYSITPQCPSSIKENGSDNLSATVVSNLSGVSVSITQENFSPVSISYSFHSGSNYTFSNLDAATYVLTYTFSGCTTSINDTVVMANYSFPSLSKSSAYQCDNNSFSVGAAVTGGISPYTYEIIASSPSTPSVVAAPQSSPIFSISNNTQYNLIRLRATDACGNAALNDVSILPLANTLVTASSDCIYLGTTLSTDSLPNATFTWYKMTDATDSVKLPSTGASYAIPSVTFADTGVYVSRMSVNAGCLTRISYFDLDGLCGGLIILPLNITLKGAPVTGGNQLSWTVPSGSGGISQYEVQRSSGPGSAYSSLGVVTADPVQSGGDFTFIDKNPALGGNSYRLHIYYTSGQDNYSNIVQLKDAGEFAVSVYPNPADKLLNISIQSDPDQRYLLSLYNILGQSVFTREVDNPLSTTIVYERGVSVTRGIYILKVLNMNTGRYNTYKVQFE
jgi:uncharacterized protein (DUF2141 family)